MEIDNRELKKELAFYADSFMSVHKNEDFVIRVYSRNINDTLQRYTISDEIDYNMRNGCPYNFKSRIKDMDILFVMWNADPNQSLAVIPIFKLDSAGVAEEARRYFPKIYKKYGMKDYRNLVIIYEPELIHLTFLRNKLIGKYKMRGMPGDRVPVCVNKKIIYI
ncbi:MAG: hypothetical protein K5854_06155 [Prevotella sp.]|nr:hypothetical protein [Prevotella sp.]